LDILECDGITCVAVDGGTPPVVFITPVVLGPGGKLCTVAVVLTGLGNVNVVSTLLDTTFVLVVAGAVLTGLVFGADDLSGPGVTVVAGTTGVVVFDINAVIFVGAGCVE